MTLHWPRAILLVTLLIGAFLCLVLALVVEDRGKWLSTAGLLFDIAGIVQLEISGLFDDLMKRYADRYGDASADHPGGLPGHVLRRLEAHWDRPIRSFLFFDLKTGFGLIFLGCVVQIAGVWTSA
jgi:hypothetical protein